MHCAFHSNWPAGRAEKTRRKCRLAQFKNNALFFAFLALLSDLQVSISPYLAEWRPKSRETLIFLAPGLKIDSTLNKKATASPPTMQAMHTHTNTHVNDRGTFIAHDDAEQEHCFVLFYSRFNTVTIDDAMTPTAVTSTGVQRLPHEKTAIHGADLLGRVRTRLGDERNKAAISPLLGSSL